MSGAKKNPNPITTLWKSDSKLHFTDDNDVSEHFIVGRAVHCGREELASKDNSPHKPN
jgi:hypothetical protein